MEHEFIERFKDLNEVGETSDHAIAAKRGYAFEDLMNDVFRNHGVLIQPSFRTADNGSEQIDGSIEVWSRVLLLETKWVGGSIAASELYGFIGKVENKLHGTLGLFISRNALSDNFMHSLSKGRRQCVLVIHGEDLDEMFKPESPSILAYIEYSLKQISSDNVNHIAFKKFAAVHTERLREAKQQEQEARRFIDECLNNPDLFVSGELEERYRKLNLHGKRDVFRYVFDHIGQLHVFRTYENTVKLTSKYQIYLALLNPDSPEIEGTQELFFKDKLMTDFRLYVALFGNLYYSYYPRLDEVTRNVFEKHFIAEVRNSKGYNSQEPLNVVTRVAEKMWWDFQPATQDELLSEFIYIYMDPFLHEDSIPKQFAKKLIDGKVIPQEKLMAWFMRKLIAYFAPKRHIDEGLIDFFIFSYERFFPVLGLKGEAIKEFVTEMAFQAQESKQEDKT